jgi:multicomponent Na+:H+ antiporter subunit C
VSDLVTLIERLPYVGVFALAAVGLYIAAAARNMLKALAGVAVLQAALALFFVAIAAQLHGRAPSLRVGEMAYGQAYANPLPQAQAIAVIVVGAGAILVGLALAVRAREAYGSVEQAEIDAADDAQDRAERGA